MSEQKNGPLDHIVFISLPEDSAREIQGFTLDPSVLIPVEFPEGSEDYTIEELSWEMIISAMLKIFAYNPAHKDAPYFKRFIDAVQPNLPAELTKTARIKAEAGDYPLAEEIFTALNHLCPEEEATFLNLAFLYERQSESANAANNFKEAGYYAEKALHIYHEALERYPESVDLHFYFGYFFLKQNDLSKALEYFELFLGLAYDDERSHQVQEVVNSIRSQTQDDNLFSAAFELIKNGQETEALERISLFIEKHPDIWNAWFLKGWAHRRLGQYRLGIDALKTCLQHEKGNTDTYNELAICCMEEGELKDAGTYLMKALALEPDNIKIISNLGVLELKNGNIEEARKYFLIASEIDPNDPVVAQYLDNLPDTE